MRGVVILVLIIYLFNFEFVHSWPPDPEPATGNYIVHDPSLIKNGDTYFLFATHGSIETRTSKDRTNWTFVGHALTWWGTTDLWAPDVSLHGNIFWLLYARSTFGSQESEIYLATSSTLEPGSWTNHGMVINSNATTKYNAIDPSAVQDENGNWAIVFGSWYGGIYIFNVDSNGKRTSEPVQLAQRPSTALEGPYMYKRNDFYYLFMSFGNCCPTNTGGLNPPGEKYHITACRSAKLTGPFVDAGGNACLKGGYLEILIGHDRYWALGGESMYYDSDKKQELLVYHWYDSEDSYSPKLGINYITWDDNSWPIAN